MVSLQKNKLDNDIHQENDPGKIKQLRQSIQEKADIIASLHNELIDDINIRYRNITHRLRMQYRELTEEDILICTMVLAGFDSLCIASLLNILPGSFNTRRFRIRKKLKLQQNLDLTVFLAQF